MVTKEWKGVGSVMTVGLEMVVALMLGLFGGQWLDKKFETGPYLTILGVSLGLVTAVKAVHRTWREMQREALREEREQGNPAPLFDKFDEEKEREADDSSLRRPDDPK